MDMLPYNTQLLVVSRPPENPQLQEFVSIDYYRNYAAKSIMI